MLATLGYASRAALMDAIVPAAIRRRDAARAARRDVRSRRRSRGSSRSPRRTRCSNRFIGQGYYGTHHAGRHPAQRAREPGVVHRVHAVPARDLAGAARSARQLPDDGLRSHRHGDRQRVDAGRGHRRRRGDDAVPARGATGKTHRFFVADDVFPQTIDVVRTRAAPLGIEVVIGPRGRRGATPSAFAACCCSIRAPTARSATIARSSRRCTRAAATSSSRPTSSR